MIGVVGQMGMKVRAYAAGARLTRLAFSDSMAGKTGGIHLALCSRQSIATQWLWACEMTEEPRN
jgi:hypothetical protein